MNLYDGISRRAMLQRAGCGFGALALAGLVGRSATAVDWAHSLAQRVPMLTPRAKRVIFIFMQGGPSHVDTFDYKKDLVARNGQELDFTGVRFGTFGTAMKRRLMKPFWKFSQYGEAGRWVSELFPHLAQHVDDVCFLHGMHTEGVAHGPATLFLHTGATNLIRPSVGAWITYGLGTENENLPGFVSIGPSPANGGPRNYGNAFLPAIYQGTTIGRAEHPETQTAFAHVAPLGGGNSNDGRQYECLQKLNRLQLEHDQERDVLEATIQSYELAFRMQQFAPDVLDISRETDETLALYGLHEEATHDFGRQCLSARRLAEAGVRYIQINYADSSSNPRWDQHDNMPAHAIHARATDRPVAGLLADLKRRGMLDETLVWWGGEFGRTPFSQNKNGRDHNPRGFTVFLAGGGTKPGFAYGETDEIGHLAVHNKVHMHDLHATILYLLGLDHERLTYRYAGRDFRLTDVAGRVVHEVIS